MIKGSIQEEDIAIVNIYAPNIGAPQYITIGHNWAHTHGTYAYYYFSNTNSFKHTTEFMVGFIHYVVFSISAQYVYVKL